MPNDLSAELISQLDELNILPDHPLVVTDADEVLFRFVACFEDFLETRDHYLDLRSFALTGNVRRRDDNEPLSRQQVSEQLGEFFADRGEHIPPVPGAAEALSILSRRAQIVVLSNIPMAQRGARSRGLEKHGMPYPMIANTGGKGGAVAALASRVEAPVFFIDDLPDQISSVARAAGHVKRLHFVADPRLAALLEPAVDCHHRTSDWVNARSYIEDELNRSGY